MLPVFCLALATYSPAQGKVALRNTPAAVQNGEARLLGPYPAEQKLRLVLALRPPHQAEEEQFLRDLHDRNSPQFHQFLSQEQWTARFAPSAEDELAVVEWARSQGLTVTHRYPHRLLVDVEATAGTIQQAFQVNLNRYQYRGRVAYSNDRDPRSPAHLEHVLQAVVGLNSLVMARAGLVKGHTGGQTEARPDYVPGPVYQVGGHYQHSGDGSKLPAAIKDQQAARQRYIFAGLYEPTDIYSSNAYDYAALQNLKICCSPRGDMAPPQTGIAIIIWDDLDFNDIDGWDALYPYLAFNIQKIFIDGRPQPDTEGEVTLDTEWAMTTSNSFQSWTTTAPINVYEGVNSHFSTLLDATSQALADGQARTLTMSWGYPEHDLIGGGEDIMDTFHNVFSALIGQGWTLVAAAGDEGATTGCESYDSVSWPASDPNIVAAGGTTLRLNGDGSYAWETAWTAGQCKSSDGGTGGGCSEYYDAYPYQNNTACSGGKRSVPDIALNADGINTPQILYWQGSLWGAGGTSIVAPELAGFFAQENSYLLALGNICGPGYDSPCGPIGSANYILYEAAVPAFTPHYPFYDITWGCNNNDITDKYHLNFYCAAPGYDRVTGWGTANMLQLAWAFNWYYAGDGGAPFVSQWLGPPLYAWTNDPELSVSFGITDSSGNGKPPNGVSGFSAAWDVDPGDVSSEATPGTGNSFYSGPQFGRQTQGSVQMGEAGQGWHTLYVRSWDNSGLSAVQTYGPVGLDTIPPVTTLTLSGVQQGGTYIGLVNVALNATDNLSGVAQTVYQIDHTPWQNYRVPFDVSSPGSHQLAWYSVDKAGNVEQTQYASFSNIIWEYTGYTLSVSLNGNGGGEVVSLDHRIKCGKVCSAPYARRARVTLKALTGGGSDFAGWSGCDDGGGKGTGPYCTLSMKSNRSVFAGFYKR